MEAFPVIEPLESRIAPATLTIANVFTNEGNSGEKTMVFTVVLDAPATEQTIYHYSTADLTADQAGVAGAGAATAGEDYTASSGDLTFEVGQQQKTFTVPIHGDITGESTEVFKVAIAKADAPATELGKALGVIQNDDPIISGTTFNEGDSAETTVTFTVTLPAAKSDAQTLHYATGTDLTGAHKATEGTDYTAASGDLTFAAGATQASFTVKINGNTTPDWDKTFQVSVSDETDTLSRATAKILNDDTHITVTQPTIVEGNSGVASAVFTFTLDAVQTFPVSFHFQSADGTATAGSDYTKVDGDVTFDPGDLTKTISVPIQGDTIHEGDENFLLKLTGASNALFKQGSTTGSSLTLSQEILNDDATLSFENLKVSETNKDHSVAFTFKLDQPFYQDVTFKVSTAAGDVNPATAGGDYTAISNQLVTIAKGAKSATINLGILGDYLAEQNETFKLSLTDLTPGVDTTGDSPVVTILNDDFNYSISADHTSFRYVDVDGDNVLVKSSLPIFTFSFVSANFQFAAADSHPDHFQLQEVDFAGALAAPKCNLQLSIEPGGTGDGKVNVGAMYFSTDMGSIRLAGDLGKIKVGDANALTPAISLLDVGSLGKSGTSTGAPDLTSLIYGPAGTVQVHGDVEGTLVVVDAGSVTGSGSIAKLAIDGALKGGTEDWSGAVQTSGKIGTATVGSILGGSGTYSGAIYGDYDNLAKIGSLRVLGSITGGAGTYSGSVIAPTISTLAVNGSVSGSTGSASGTIQAGILLGQGTIKGSLVGGAGNSSGQIFAAKIASLTLNDSLTGGSGIRSGAVISAGEITNLNIKGSIQGGTAGSEAAEAHLSDINNDNSLIAGQSQTEGFSGSVYANKIGKVTVGVSILGGNPDSGQPTKYSARVSGIIFSETSIDSLTVGKDVKGGAGAVGALIQAGTSFGKISIGGDLTGGAGGSSGLISAGRASGTLQIGGNLLGGAGTYSGKVSVPYGLQSVTIGNNVQGGTGLESGMIDARSHGALPSLVVKGSVIGGSNEGAGSFAAASVGRISIGGNLMGGSADKTGFIFSQSTIDSVAIGGGITGGGGEWSGSVITNRARIGKVSVGFGITGGAGTQSGFINSDSIGTVTVGGVVTGGAGTQSGAISSDETAITSLSLGGLQGGGGTGSGAVKAKGIGSATLRGNLVGGAGDNSGSITANGGDIGKITLVNLQGGAGNGSGVLITDGVLSNAKITGDLVGGNAASGKSLEKSGYVQARQIASLTVAGSIKAGLNSGDRLVDSGVVRATEDILFLSAGGLEGSATNKVIISAQGSMDIPEAATSNVAIKNLNVRGNVSKTEILAGYGVIDSDQTGERGTPLNADAQIEKVVVSGNWSASSLVAGVMAGDDGVFGTGDDKSISGDGVYDVFEIFAKISSIIVSGTGSGGAIGEHYGIVAELVTAAKFKGVAVPVTPKADNPGVAIGGDSTFKVLEVIL